MHCVDRRWQSSRGPRFSAQSTKYRGGGAGSFQFWIFAAAGGESVRSCVSRGAVCGGGAGAVGSSRRVWVGGRSRSGLRAGGWHHLVGASGVGAQAAAARGGGAGDPQADEIGAGGAAVRLRKIRAEQ